MRKALLLLGLLSMAALASCSIKDVLQPEPVTHQIRGTLEQLVPEASTKAFAEFNSEQNKYYIFWNENDPISIFKESNLNRKYIFDGFDGAPSGTFTRVEDGSGVSGSDPIETGYQYAIFPYDKKFNSCTQFGALTVMIPAEQSVHGGDTPGVGARIFMVARDTEGDFSFKHVGSYIAATLKGEGVSVASISFRGNNSEIMAGLSTVTFDANGEPVTEFDPKYKKYHSEVVTMNFETPVVLGSEETEFWLAVPSITLSKGYTLTVTDTDGGVFEKKTTSSLTLKRKNFYHCRAEVETSPATTDGSAYTKVSSIVADGAYLVVNVADNLAFTGAADGSSVGVSPMDGVIIDPDGSMASYEYTVESKGSNYYLKYNDGKYLICDYSSAGNTTSGISYVNSQTDVRYPYTLTTSNGAFFFNTTRADNGSANQYLYYKTTGTNANIFKIGGSGSDVGVHLYLKTGGKQLQTLSFAEPTVTWKLGEGYEIGQSYPFPQTVTGNKTEVTYSSENEDVATIRNNRILIVGAGSATIKADAIQNDEFFAGSASYTLNIAAPAPEGWQDKGSFNLENKAVQDYLTAAAGSYTDTDEKTNTIVSQYVRGSAYSSITRKDCPAPVTLTWTNSATTSTIITIFSDEALSQKVWSQNATRDTKSADVYNLTPGLKYYYTVSENGTIWEKGFFNTTGRRRMIRVSGTESENNANNCRDLGGMVTKDGSKRIKYGYIFRGSNMDNTTNPEKDILVNFMKIRMDIDLRASNAWGTQAANREFSANNYPEVGYLNRGFTGYDDLASDAGLGRVGDIFNAIMDTVLGGEAVYFHCYVGADRTGIIGVMLEGLLGISEKDCSIDYELTSFCSPVGMRPRDGSQNDHYFSKGLALLRSQSGETFQDKCNSFLTSRKVGVSQAKIDQFKSFILENNN